MKIKWQVAGWLVIVLYALLMVWLVTGATYNNEMKVERLELPEREEAPKIVVEYRRPLPSGRVFYYMNGWTCSDPCID